MSEYQTRKPYRPRRNPSRAAYEKETVHAILDAGYVAHVAFEGVGGPSVIPMYYVRDGESVLVHASTKSGLAQALGMGKPVSIAVTHLDGLIFARSWFHHSVNYRSVIAHGVTERLEGDEKWQALKLFIDRLLPGRADETRGPNPKEMKATAVFRLPLDQVAAKVRTGGPVDDEEDMGLPCWAGVVPVATTLGDPIDDPLLRVPAKMPAEIA